MKPTVGRPGEIATVGGGDMRMHLQWSRRLDTSGGRRTVQSAARALPSCNGADRRTAGLESGEHLAHGRSIFAMKPTATRPDDISAALHNQRVSLPAMKPTGEQPGERQHQFHRLQRRVTAMEPADRRPDRSGVLTENIEFMCTAMKLTVGRPGEPEITSRDALGRCTAILATDGRQCDLSGLESVKTLRAKLIQPRPSYQQFPF
jgi:hypothetical protein